MKVTIKNDLGALKAGEDVAIFLHEELFENNTYTSAQGYEFIKGADIGHFKGKSSEIYYVKLEKKPGVLICGLGSLKKINDECLRNASAAVIKYSMSKNMRKISLLMPDLKGIEVRRIVETLTEGALLANYNFNRYKSDNDSDNPVNEITIYIAGTDITGEFQSVADAIKIMAENTYLCRDIVNDTSDSVNPVTFAGIAEKIAAECGLKCTILDKKAIEKKKMGLILAVNRGSEVQPRVVILEHAGDPRSKKKFGLVGKGITFDSGGMDLKPAASMETMRCDMAGAASVLFTMKTLAEQKIKKNVTAVIPLTENMLSSNAFRPGDIFKGYSGKTIEIGNTDAEGRLILSDALSYMEKEIKPDVIVDLATLTGSCVVTFGETVAAYLSTDENISSLLEASSSVTGERIWRLPLFDDYDDRMKSDIADLNNMSSEKNAGAISAAVFLRNFIEKTPWAHIDIAGTAWYSKQRGYRPKFATGYGIRLMLEVIKNWK